MRDLRPQLGAPAMARGATDGSAGTRERTGCCRGRARPRRGNGARTRGRRHLDRGSFRSHHSGVRTLPTGTVTFLFTDVEGSTRLLHDLGDDYAEVLAEHRHALREAFARHGGVE